MSILLALALTLGAPATDYALTCTGAATPDGDGAKQFALSFSADGAAVKRIAISDPDHVLDPLGALPVFEYSGGAMTQSRPPSARMRLSGAGQGEGGFVIHNTDPRSSFELTLTPRNGGGFSYSFTGVRMMDRTLRAEFEGAGTCAAKAS